MAVHAANPHGASPIVTFLTIVAWYTSNIGVLLLNKYLLSSTGFHHPVFLTLCHMLACTAIGGGASLFRILPMKPVKSWQQFMKIAVLAVVFCLTVVLGNASLKFIPVSFNQAIGSTTPFFTAVLAYAMQGHREVPLTYYSLIPIMAGVVVASGGEPLFNIIGFTFCLTATALRALKSVLQSILMTDPSEKLDPMSLLLYMSATSVMLLVPMAAVVEPGAFGTAVRLIRASPHFGYWLLGNSALAYFVNLTNFLVTKYTSALTLQVLGNAKGVVAAAVSVAVFRNMVTAQGCGGYAITVAGVFMYSESKRRAKAAAASASANAKAEGEGNGSSGGGKNSNERETPVATATTTTGAAGDLYFRGPERA
ncbi:putative sugar phosphate/phosphate translocator [Tetrabaena socialis]|uniref:Putative sugar phosphate/phosphate translocator n=1 Tax=Tetrabaena socialis TaxID=47790 RepID=A0A2J8AAR5_9CHLO|nr:putative sugar phosphate/phosphate translocator [Tetrabaena socialis]|eukprot:PNH09611.1 putative sugar phosphate/phosphate translocator [Tetrabaena socialis]